MAYTLQNEAQRIFHKIISDPRLLIPDEIKAQAGMVKFVGEETQPYYPTPWKAAETQAALLGSIGLFATAISKERYGLDEIATIDLENALLSGLAIGVMRGNGKPVPIIPKTAEVTRRWDHGNTRELYRQLGTNIYKTRDGQWYQLHGSMDATPLLRMLNLPQHDEKNRSWSEIIDMYAEVVGQIDAEELDTLSNNVYRIPGCRCLKLEEFETLPHGKAIKDEPWYNLIPQPYYEQPPAQWILPPDTADRRPLSGIKVLDVTRAVAGPTIAKVLAALGATVIRVASSANNELPVTLIEACLNKISVDIDLKTIEGRKKLLELTQDADVFIDGYRPSVLEHLGFGRDAVFGLVSARSRGIVYCQENCYGWKGPWSGRPGWAQIGDTASGVGFACGKFHGYDEPHIFPGPNADYLCGHAGAIGALHALYQRSKTGGSYLVQPSLIVSNLQMMSYGQYSDEQITALKKRNKSIIRKPRYYDDIMAQSSKNSLVEGVCADRPLEKALRGEFYQSVDGSSWGYDHPLEVIRMGVTLSTSRTDFALSSAPCGYYLPQWELKKNPDFVPL
ncbi:hypothetical protein CLAIMM_11911 [Cladophialophora immunda]|nr:hypothetical protein CLAIMM_11911 [Cladophialophora immunda]